MLNTLEIVQRKAEAPKPLASKTLELRKVGRNWEFVILNGNNVEFQMARFISRDKAMGIARELCKQYNCPLRIVQNSTPRTIQKRHTLVRR